MRQEIPAGILELLTVPGLRADKALTLYKELGISSVEELEQAAKQERLKNVKGLGSALQRKILQGIEIKRRSEGLRHLHRAAALLELAQAQLMRSRPGVSRVTPAGDFRRGCELIGDLSLVAQVSDSHGAVSKQEDQSELALHLTDKQHYGAALLLATGSQEHLKELRKIAAARGMGGRVHRRGRECPYSGDWARCRRPPAVSLSPELGGHPGECERTAIAALRLSSSETETGGKGCVCRIGGHADKGDRGGRPSHRSGAVAPRP